MPIEEGSPLDFAQVGQHLRDLQPREMAGEVHRPRTRARPAQIPGGVFASVSLSMELGAEEVGIIEKALSLHRRQPEVEVFSPGEVIMASDRIPERVYLIMSGSARGVITHPRKDGSLRGRKPVFSLYREGLWVGLPYGLTKGRPHRPVLSGYEVRATSKVEAVSMPVDALRELVGSHPRIARYVESRVCGRFGNKRRLLEELKAMPMLSVLEPADQAWLFQVGAIRRHAGGRQVYMTSGQLSKVVAVLLRGNAQSYMEVEGRQVLVGSYDEGDLIGHEQLATAEEESLTALQTHRPDPIAAELPRRLTSVYLTSDAVVLELNWRAFRWLMYEKRQIWRRLVNALMPGEVELPEPSAPIVVFYGVEGGLGTTTLAHGTAVALARSPFIPDAPVCLIDVQRFSGLTACALDSGGEWLVGDLVDGDDDDFEYQYAEVDVGARLPIQVAWCKDRARTDSLVRYLRQQGLASVIVISGDDTAPDGHLAQIQGEPVSERHREAMALAERLNDLGVTAVWLTDDPHKAYRATEAAPLSLIRAERLTEAFCQSECIRARIELTDWKEQMPRRRETWLQDVRRLLDELDFINREDEDARLYNREDHADHTLRVPNDRETVESFNKSPHGAFLDAHKGKPMVETFERLARMIQGRTVGLALGGGGAWGFTQIALIKALKEADIPIDYISGTSFGSVVAGLYAAGGLKSLDKLMEWCQEPLKEHSAFQTALRHMMGLDRRGRPIVLSRLTKGVFSAILDNRNLQLFIDEIIAESTGQHRMPLSTTHIPFSPVGTSLNDGLGVVLEHGTVGFGVRSASCLPPLFPALWVGTDRIIDGALVSNVPVEASARRGADFVIGCNVVPPNPPKLDAAVVRRALAQIKRDNVIEAIADLKTWLDEVEKVREEHGGTPPVSVRLKHIYDVIQDRPIKNLFGEVSLRTLSQLNKRGVAGGFQNFVKEVLLVRVLDAMHGFYLLSWRQGQDQGQLNSHFIINMQPYEYDSHQFWLGREIAESFSGYIKTNAPDLGDMIRARWEDKKHWRGTPPSITIGSDADSRATSTSSALRNDTEAYITWEDEEPALTP